MPKLSKKKVIGITGSMGSGKSEISRYLSQNYPVLDCDQVNAQLLEKGNAGYEELKKRKLVDFDADGNINKKSMAAFMFSSDQNRKLVESILHPLIFEQMHQWNHFDSIWCVISDLDVALYRLQTYRNFTREQALARLMAQMNPEEKMAQSNIILRNNGTVLQLHHQIDDALRKERV